MASPLNCLNGAMQWLKRDQMDCKKGCDFWEPRSGFQAFLSGGFGHPDTPKV